MFQIILHVTLKLKRREVHWCLSLFSFTENAVKSEAHRTNKAIGTCRKLVGHFSHSWKKKEALREAQRELNLPEHAMLTDCQTRWGSTQKMISRILEQQHALTKVLSTDRKARHLLPSWQDLDVLESINRALSPLQDFTDALSAEQYVSISYLKPILHILNTSVLAEDPQDTDLTKSLKAKILRYLNEKYEVTQDLLNITMFLDPRFKAKYMSTEETRTIKEQVISEVISNNFLFCCHDMILMYSKVCYINLTNLLLLGGGNSPAAA